MGESGTSITLVVAAAGRATRTRAPILVAGADEVIEVGVAGEPMLSDAVSDRTSFRYLRSQVDARAHALNLGVSFASGEWVVICFGDETLSDGWLGPVRRAVGLPGARPVHLFHSDGGSEIPLVVVRRPAFVYGAFDERFASDRLVALHWAHRVYASRERRVLDEEGIARHCWPVPGSSGCPPVDRPIVGLMELWNELPAGTRAAILDQALAEPGALQVNLREVQAGLVEHATTADPYRSTAIYEAKQFWERNSTGYIRWEIYQPDEPEIRQMIDRVAPRSVLELGCGAGRNTRYFGDGDHGESVAYAGIDVSVNLLRRAAERQLAGSMGIACGDITTLPFAADAFDLVFSDSTIQHVPPDRIDQCIGEIERVAANFICLIEYTENDEPGADWFGQVHMFSHDYGRLLARGCDLVWRTDTSLRVHPARKEVFLFRKRPRG